jgi:hypothetical protein
MQGPKYKLYVRNSQGYYLYRDELETIQYTNTKTALKFAPDGWMNMIASIVRNKEYRGVFRKVATPLKFTGDGKAIIDYIAVYEGVNAYLELIIEVQKPENFDYELFFHGTMDFKDGYRYFDDFSTINILEVLLIDIIEAKKDVVYSIPLTNDNSGLVQMDGLNLVYKTDYIISDGFGTSSSWNTGRHIVELLFASNENPYSNETKRTKWSGFNADLPATNAPFYRSSVKGRLKITYDFRINIVWVDSGSVPGPGSDYRLRLIVAKPNGTFIGPFSNDIYRVSGQDNVFSVSYLSGKWHDVKGVFYLDVEPGDSVYFAAFPTGMVADAEPCRTTYAVTPAEFSLETTQRAPATLHRFIRPWKLWQELIYKATDGKYSAASPFLFGNENHILIPGTALRGEANPTVQTTIKEFLQYCWVQLRGVISEVSGNTAIIDEYSNTFKQEVLEHLGLVKDFEWEFDKDALVSSIIVGYENIDFGVDGQINGKDEFNQKNYYTTGQESIDAKYEIICPYPGSMYIQELMRVKFGSRKTTDNKGDNKLYLVDAEQGAVVQHYSGNISFIASNTIRLEGTLGSLNGRQITITGAGSFDGVYDVINTSYLETGYTRYSVSQAVFNVNTAGVITYIDTDVWKPVRPAYVSITGLLSPETAYNTRISPKNILRLHAPIIGAGVYNVNASDALDIIKFQSGDKNILLSVSYDGITFITENADERFSQLQQPFTMPIKFYFKTDYSNNVFATMAGTNKYKQISFQTRNVTLAGYIEEIRTNADTREAQSWELKSIVSTNLINLLTWRRF